VPKRVFVSWSGDAGRQIAEALKRTILDYPDLEAWISSQSLEAGKPWFDEIDRATAEAEFAVGCMTPGATKKPWVNFEAGMLYGRLKNFKMLRVGEQPLSGPLAHLQSVDGMSRAEVTRMLQSMTADHERAARYVEIVFERWLREVDEVISTHYSHHEIQDTAETLHDATLSMTRKPSLSENDCLRAIILLSLGDLQKELQGAVDSYSAPQLEYPYHLIHLQRNHNAVVKAVALLQEEEQFWQKRTGLEIRDSAHPDSERVFVVRSPGQLEEHWETILQHAKRYSVSILSYDDLARHFEDRFVRDFSVLDVNRSKVVAAYANTNRFGKIEYVATLKTISEFEQAYARITQRATLIDRADPPDLDTCRAMVFADRTLLSRLGQRPVEMSVYVPVEDYDAHEEEHAYYVEMMAAMIQAFRNHWKDDGGPYRVLELGAGTGIFTKRLASLSSVDELVALEIDWACHQKLAYNSRNIPKIKAYNKDSREFNPSGHFHAIFSSFADHHIKTQDKTDYLRNVARNLRPGGIFVVGDEFLRPHSSTDRQAKLDALAAYHGHIIEIAKASGNEILVMLETAAWESGKNEIGDFKISCNEYEAHLRARNFVFERQKIGPSDINVEREVGGVYVYVSRLK
jgi:SAM-dependent methyltransferase